MNTHTKNPSHLCAFLFGVLTLVATAPEGIIKEAYPPLHLENVSAYLLQQKGVPPQQRSIARNPFAAQLGSAFALAALEERIQYPDTMEYRIAQRLKNRLRLHGEASPSVPALANAIRQRQQLLRRALTVTFQTQDGGEYGTWDVSLQRYPTWVAATITSGTASFHTSSDRITADLANYLQENIAPPVDVRARAVSQTGSVARIVVDDIAMPGYEIDTATLAKEMEDSLNEGTAAIVAPMSYRNGQITLMHNGQERTLQLISSGRSNFKGSTWARMKNVRKALREHVNNALIEQGAMFSFNAALNPPVTLSKGWSMAKVIYNGTELRESPGGGICQASTTTFRAIVNGGFPVVDRKSHSLYVTYYKQYGVGIDATVYPGSQDLRFMNDTADILVLQAYDTEDLDAVVNIYGIPDGRTVELAGPFFASSAPDELQVNGRAVWYNEIVWLQDVRYSNGQTRSEQIVSRYLNMPRSLSAEFPSPLEIQTIALGLE
ncbi:MAG: VanW family protein [Candidatus Peribacteraceae bacterium]|jgi:vancomycin resistance protein YoaR